VDIIETDTSEEPATLKKSSFVIDTADEALLDTYFGTELKGKILKFHESVLAKPTAKPSVFGHLHSDPITDRVLRGKIHQDVRRIFSSKLDTEVIEGSLIQITAAPPVKAHPDGYARQQGGRAQNSHSKGKLGWNELGGEYLHFSLYKENKDTMEVISFISRALRMKPKDFAFAG
jgi:tRNA pseudouridine13 synthase